MNINYCPRCNNLMIKQYGWIENQMIEYEVCIYCGFLYSNTIDVEILKDIEKKRFENP